MPGSERSAVEKVASCHCGAVQIPIPALPTEVTDCNCSLCRRYGVLWAYFQVSELGPLPDASLTHFYEWGDRNVRFHRCRGCGCVTHWIPTDPAGEWRGINARLFPPRALETLRVRHKDGADTGEYLD